MLLDATTKFKYDRQDRLISEELLDVLLSNDPASKTNLTTHYTYDAVGNLLQVDSPGDPNSTSTAGGLASTLNDYDALNRLVRTEVLADGGQIVFFNRDAAGDVVVVKEQRFTPSADGMSLTHSELVTTNEYDAFGRMIESIDAGPEANAADRTTSYAYDRLGLSVTSTDRYGNQSTSVSDGGGQVRVQTSPDGSQLTISYNTAGDVVETILEFDPNSPTATSFRRTITEYDLLGRPRLWPPPSGAPAYQATTSSFNILMTTMALLWDHVCFYD